MEPRDWGVVECMLVEMLNQLRPFGSSALSASSTALADLALGAARRGDPVLVAEDLGGDAEFVSPVIGLCLWMGISSQFVSDERELHALGTFVEEDYRGQGVANLLRDKATEMAKSLGYRRICGTVHKANKVGLESLERHGWKTNYYGVTKEL